MYALSVKKGFCPLCTMVSLFAIIIHISSREFDLSYLVPVLFCIFIECPKLCGATQVFSEAAFFGS